MLTVAVKIAVVAVAACVIVGEGIGMEVGQTW